MYDEWCVVYDEWFDERCIDEWCIDEWLDVRNTEVLYTKLPLTRLGKRISGDIITCVIV